MAREPDTKNGTVTNNMKLNGYDVNATASHTSSSLQKRTKPPYSRSSALAAQLRDRRRLGEASRRKQKANW